MLGFSGVKVPIKIPSILQDVFNFNTNKIKLKLNPKVKITWEPSDHLWLRIRLPSWLRMARDVLDVVVLCSPRSCSCPRERCGTGSASIVPGALDLWTPCSPVTVRMTTSTANSATRSCTAPRDSDTDTPPLWCPPTTSTRPAGKHFVLNVIYLRESTPS